jgi:MFS family permease
MSLNRIHYGWIVLAMSTMVVFGALGLARFGYTMVLPSMQAGLTLDNTQAGALATANLLGYLALCVIGGMLAARFGPRTVIAAALGLVGVSMLLTGLAAGFWTASVYRALAGIGSGASNVPAMGLMAAWFAKRRRGMAAGIAAAGSSLGLMVVGPLVPRLLIRYGESGWRACWFVFGVITIFLAIAVALILRNRPSDMGLHPVGAREHEKVTLPDAKAGLQWSKVYRSGTVWHLGLVYAAFGFSYIIYMTFFVKGLIAQGNYAPAAAGRLFMLMGWLALLCGLIWGTLSDVIGRKAALIFVFLVHAASFSLFAVSRGPLAFTISAALYGLSAWSIPAIMAAACGDMLGPRLTPAALGFVTLFMGIGQAAGPSVAGAMADATGSFRAAFLLAAAVALIGAMTAATLRTKEV